jgi:anti-sigma B factor antagonist
MNITIQETDAKIVATLAGELDTAAAQEAEKQLQPLLDSKGKEVVLDCTDLEYISSSGLRVLLKNVNDVIRDVLDLTGFISIFEFE